MTTLASLERFFEDFRINFGRRLAGLESKHGIEIFVSLPLNHPFYGEHLKVSLSGKRGDVTIHLHGASI